MNNIRAVAGHFVLSSMKNRILFLLFLLFLVFSILSVYVGSSTIRAELRAYNDAVQMLTARHETNIPAAPVISPLSVMKNSIDYILMAGALIAIFLGFDAVSREHENHSLKLLLAHPMHRDEILTGKLGGAGAIFLGLNLAAFVLELVCLFGVSSAAITPLQVGQLGLFHLVSVFYMLLFFLWALLFSILFLRSEAAFTASVTLWVGLTYVLPELAKSVRTYSMTADAASQAVQTAQIDTPLSLFIAALSPAEHFRAIGRFLLDSGPAVSGGMLITGTVYLIILFGFLLMFSYAAFNKREVVGE